MKPSSGVPGFSQVVLVGSETRGHFHDEQGNQVNKNKNITEGQSLIMAKQFLSGAPCTRGQLLKWCGNKRSLKLTSKTFNH